MNKLMTLAAACMLAASLPAYAADPTPAQKAQQDKMAACNTKSEGKTGDERKKFMSECMSAKPAEPAKPESKMAMCNKQTAGLSGDARSKAQSECMKGPATAAAPAKAAAAPAKAP
jgi:psiF repeat